MVVLTILFFGKGVSLLAQGNDPVLAGMILMYTDKAKKELKQQEKMMLLESTGHIWIKEEVEGTSNPTSTLINRYYFACHVVAF